MDLHWKEHLAQECPLSSCLEGRRRKRKELREYVSFQPTSNRSQLSPWPTGELCKCTCLLCHWFHPFLWMKNREQRFPSESSKGRSTAGFVFYQVDNSRPGFQLKANVPAGLWPLTDQVWTPFYIECRVWVTRPLKHLEMMAWCEKLFPLHWNPCTAMIFKNVKAGKLAWLIRFFIVI